MLRTSDKRLHLRDELSEVFADITPAWASIAPPVTGYIAHYDGSDASTITWTTGRVSAWADKVGSFNATNGTASTRASFPVTVRPDGPKALVFTNGQLLISSLSTSDISSTWFAAGCLAGDAGILATVFGASGGGGIQVRLDPELTVLKQASAVIGVSTAAVPLGTPFVVAVVLDASNCVTYVGGVSETDAHAQTLTAGRTLTIGTNPSTAGEGFSGWLGEMICYGTTLTDAQVRLNLAYLAQKWGASL